MTAVLAFVVFDLGCCDDEILDVFIGLRVVYWMLTEFVNNTPVRWQEQLGYETLY